MKDLIQSWGIPLILLVGIGWLLYRAWPRIRAALGREQAPQQTDSGQSTPGSVQELAAALQPIFEASAHPADMLSAPLFEWGARQMAQPEMTVEELINTCIGANKYLSPVAAEALARRADSAPASARVVPYLEYANVWTAFYILRFLDAQPSGPVVCDVLLAAPDWWASNPLMPKIVSDFIDARRAKGEVLDLRQALEKRAPDDPDALSAVLGSLLTPAKAELVEALRAWQHSRVERGFLNQIGRVWPDASAGPPVIAHDRLLAGVEAGLEVLSRQPPASFVILGEPGTGKTTLFQTIAARLVEQGWTIFEASARDLIAGQAYVGQLEQRVRELLPRIEVGRRVIWYVPALHQLFYAGRHQFSPLGALDLVLPAIESGSICVVGETEPAALEKILPHRPRLRTAFKSLRVEALSDAETLELAGRLVAEEYAPKGVTVEPALLREALEMSRHYLGSRAQPGSLIALVRAAAARAMSADGERAPLTREHFLGTISQLTGLPRDVLDDREGLDPQALRALFGKRVMGQPEAVECLIDRIAMLKAGLTDPNRPIGVFLFAGPTGTGKTEAAKTLAEFLFGSTSRMIRLDMSEFQEPTSLARLIGEPGELAEASALTNRIRQQPFAVVLLDEFEKAHPRVWDVFLQVFDDARLTDAQGNVADFRYSIIILTTNLGATEHRGSSLGFTDSASGFAASQILRVIGTTFRPEFVNRLDRVVVFRPLSKAVMRDILRKELDSVLQRRGFRHREWAVEWEESAIDFLLEKGFTPDMGARPLRRAIEQHLLAPIAMTIVEHRFPEGDQFLFVRSDGHAIQVEFVDPDAPVPESAAEATRRDSAHLPSLILSPAGTSAAIALLEQEITAFEEDLAEPSWTEAKRALFERMNEEGFWRHLDRFEVLGRIELMDRIEAGLTAARSLLRRISTRTQRNAAAPRSLVESLAQQLYLLRAAQRDLYENGTSDAYLSVEAVAVESHSGDQAGRWEQQLASMYREWARKRHVRTQVVGAAGPCVLAMNGLGAHQILKREPGLHVFEIPDTSGGFRRSSARVRVVPQPFAPRSPQQSELQHALASLSAAPPSASVVRRYREQPSPLVRDAVAGWRSGRLDQILGGDFDLMTEPATQERD